MTQGDALGACAMFATAFAVIWLMGFCMSTGPASYHTPETWAKISRRCKYAMWIGGAGTVLFAAPLALRVWFAAVLG